jgi:hypothetical protein
MGSYRAFIGTAMWEGDQTAILTRPWPGSLTVLERYLGSCKLRGLDSPNISWRLHMAQHRTSGPQSCKLHLGARTRHARFRRSNRFDLPIAWPRHAYNLGSISLAWSHAQSLGLLAEIGVAIFAASAWLSARFEPLLTVGLARAHVNEDDWN